MIIHVPELEISNGEICLSARIETERIIPYLPDRLWYRFPEAYQSYVTTRSDSFLVSLLLLAMRVGEDITVMGMVSPRLAGNIPAIQQVYLDKKVERLRPVRIEYAELTELPADQVGRGVGTAFSGGIDSLYVLFANLIKSTAPPAERLTHGIFINGFDIFLHQKDTYQNLYRKYSLFFEQLGLQLLSVHTNVYAITQFRVDWNYANETALGGVALLFGRLWLRFYKPGGLEARDGKPCKPGYYTVPLMSTERMQIMLDHPKIPRIDKLDHMADWWGAQQNLRVCASPNKNPDGTACYRCGKCLNTLSYLELLGIREKFITFPKPYKHVHLLKFSMATNDYPSFYPDNPNYYKKYGRMDLYLLFFLLYLPMSIKPFIKKLLARWLRDDWLYRLERWTYRSHLEPKQVQSVRSSSDHIH